VLDFVRRRYHSIHIPTSMPIQKIHLLNAQTWLILLSEDEKRDPTSQAPTLRYYVGTFMLKENGSSWFSMSPFEVHLRSSSPSIASSDLLSCSLSNMDYVLQQQRFDPQTQQTTYGRCLFSNTEQTYIQLIESSSAMWYVHQSFLDDNNKQLLIFSYLRFFS